jgi:signal transduction histidine kinase
LFGYSETEALSQARAEQLYPSEFRAAIAAGESGGVWPEATVTDRKGQPIPVRFSGVVLSDGGRFLGAGAFLQDLRPLKQLQAEKLEAERLAVVGQTVAGLAHGVKNLLMGLEGGMYVVRSGITRENPERIQRGWAMLEDNIARISSFVKDFLGFARGRQPVVAFVDPNAIVQQVVDLFRDTAAQSGIAILAELQENLAPAPLDAEGIHTCLSNLVSNALDACEMSEKTSCHVIVRSREEDHTLIFEMADNGCGMDYEVKQKVFTSFFTTKGSDRGTGLGLLATRKIVQEHGGKITFESTEGEGSLFRIELPRARLPGPTAEE